VQLPSEVVVGPFTYAVLSDELAAAKAKADSESIDNVGLHDSAKQTITVDPAQGPDSLASTVLHEVLHAIWYGVGLQESDAKEQEERVVSAITHPLLDTLRRNPDLVKYLTRG